MRVLGSVIAGGASTRYGSPKALADVGGRRVVDRVAAALRDALDGVAATGDVVAIVNDAALAAEIGLPHRADLLDGIGPLAGVHAALHWARERGDHGILAAGCDLPFLEPDLLRELVRRSAAADAVIPASEGRRGLEPLCAFYGTSCLPAIEHAVAGGDTRMIAFHAAIRLDVLPLDVVRTFGDPDRMFLNVNTTADRAAADRQART